MWRDSFIFDLTHSSARPNQSCMYIPPHKIMRYFIYYSTQLASSFPPGKNLPGGNDLYHSCTSFEGASWRGQPLNIFTCHALHITKCPRTNWIRAMRLYKRALQKSPAKEPCKRALQKSPIFPQKSPICHRISEDKSNSSNAPLQKSLQKSPIVPQKSPIYYRISEDKSNSSNASVARAAPL